VDGMEENKSIVTSYRLSQDTKDKLQKQLKELGLTQEQYFNKVVQIMELENVKQNNFLNANTTVIENNLNAILNAFINIADSSNNLISNKDIELEELQTKYKDMLLNKENSITQLIQELQGVYTDLSVLQQESIKHKEELENIKLETKKQLEMLQGQVIDKNNLIVEYKAKIDTLSGLVTEYTEYKEQNKTLTKEILNKDKELNILNANLDNANKELEKNNKVMEQDQEQHKKDLDTLKDKLEFVKNKEILVLKQEQQAQLQEQQEKYNNKIQELLNKLENKPKTKPKTKIEQS
jgi:hypothetical protein